MQCQQSDCLTKTPKNMSRKKPSHAASMTIDLSTFSTWGFWLVPEPMLATIAILSTWKTMWWLFQANPQHMMAWRTAYISLNCISLLRNWRGHRVENHSSLNHPPRPFRPLHAGWALAYPESECRSMLACRTSTIVCLHTCMLACVSRQTLMKISSRILLIL